MHIKSDDLGGISEVHTIDRQHNDGFVGGIVQIGYGTRHELVQISLHDHEYDALELLFVSHGDLLNSSRMSTSHEALTA